MLLQNSAMLAWLEREGLQAGRRPLRFALQDLDRVWTEDGLKLHFVLARGCYATSLIRELCITDGSEQETKLEP